MLRFTFCPRVTLLSLTTFVLIANLVLFQVCVWQGVVVEGSLMQVQEATLVEMGAMVPSAIK
jgi:hypothetical protein